MRRLRDLWYRLMALVRPGTMEREMSEEFAFHVEMETRKLEQSGMPSAEAARVARPASGKRPTVPCYPFNRSRANLCFRPPVRSRNP